MRYLSRRLSIDPSARLWLTILFLTSVLLIGLVPAAARAAFDTLDAPGAWDLLHDEGRDLLYLSTDGGQVLRYDIAAEAFLTPITIGQRPLSELTISPDGASLVVVEIPTPGSVMPRDWTGLFSIDLESLVVSRITDSTESLAVRSFDALFLADGSLLISTSHPRNPFGRVPVYRYDPTTSQYSVVISTDGPALLALSADKLIVLMSSTVRIRNGSSLTVTTVLYEPATGVLRSRFIGKGFSPTFLHDAENFATVSGVRQNTFLGPRSIQIWLGTTNSFRTAFSPIADGRYFSRDTLALEWAPDARRVYSSWRGTAGASIVVHAYPIRSRFAGRIGILDASTSEDVTAESRGFFGRMNLLPDESRLFVVTPDEIRIYDPAAFLDSDQDGISSFDDNCPNVANPEQRDLDRNGLGNACNERLDRDADEVEDDRDNCPDIPNSFQANFDGSQFGNACNDHEDRDGDDWRDAVDNCPDLPNDQANQDSDRFGDACDIFPFQADHVLAQARLERDDALADVVLLREELSLVSADLAICLDPPDADGDGLTDARDECSDTAVGVVIDAVGCSKSQFCEAIEIDGWQDIKRCVDADWTGPVSAKGQRGCRLRWRDRRVGCAAQR